MPSDYAHSHKGHRSRMRDRYKLMGLDGFAPHEALELLLYSVIPHRDINPLAHSLIDRFGSLDGVLNAPEEELKAMPGLGGKSAEFIVGIGRAATLYASYCDNRIDLSRLSRAEDYVRQLFSGEDCRQTWVVCMDKMGRLVGSGVISSGERDAGLLVRDAMKLVIRHYASMMMLIDRRLPERMEVTVEDENICFDMAKAASRVSVMLIDMILASNAEIISLRRMKVFNPKLKEAQEGIAGIYLSWLE